MGKEKRIWLWAGLASFILMFLYSFVRSFPFPNFESFVLDSIDWLAASVIFFFLGATLAYKITWMFNWIRGKKISIPLWVWFTGILWIVSVVFAFALAWPESFGRAVMYLFFPVIYGVFFTSYAWTAVFTNFTQTLYGKFILNIAYLAVFFAWLTLEVKSSKLKHLKSLLLVLLFLVLFVGMVSCTSSLR